MRHALLLVLLLAGLAAAHDGPYAHNNNDAKIAEMTEELRADPDNKKLLRDRAYAYLQQDEYESSLADLDHLLRLDPKYEGGHVARAWVRIKIQDLKGAIDDLDPLCAAGSAVPGVWFLRGETRHALGEHKGALADLDHAIGMTTKYRHGFLVRSRVRAALGDLAGARADLDTLLDNDNGRDMEGLIERALLCVASDWDRAKKDMESAESLEGAPKNAAFLAAEARVQLRRNGMTTEIYDKALDAYDRDTKFARSPNRKAELLLETARLRADFGDLWPALVLVDDALKLAPERVDANRLRVALMLKADGVKPEILESAKKKLAEVEAARGIAAVGSAR